MRIRSITLLILPAVAVAVSVGMSPSGGAGVAAVPARATAGMRATGAVEGMVRVTASAEAEPPMLSPYARRRYRPPSPSAPTPGSPTNVVVYVIVEGATPPPPMDATIEQRDRAIVPHVTAVQRGGRIHFPNRDDVFHNLFSLSEANPFNLGRYPPGESRSETFRRTGVVRMFCDIHSEMGGTILVLDTWLFARPDAGGEYRIEGVPAGRHRVVAWHEAVGADTATVTVRDGAVTRTDFELAD
jgi:hypothetical protein